LSAWLAPLFLIVGFTVGAWVQPEGYHWQWDAISSLASSEAHQRWWMNGGFVGVGLCHLLTARQLRRSYGSAMLALGGLGVLMVAVFPELPGERDSILHDTGAGLAFFWLAIWPLFAVDERAWATRRKWAAVASGTMFALLAWFLFTLFGVPALGVAERLLAVAESLWPLVVLRSQRRAA
jgi:hypothetical membrane protein